jgi:type I restriction enzyme S subunit
MMSWRRYEVFTFYKEMRFKETRIGKMPEDWTISRLGDAILEAKSGFASGRRDPSGITQLRMDNIDTRGHIRKDAGVKVPIPKDFENYLLQPGDILFNNTNSVDMIGKTAIFHGEFLRCVYSNHLTRIRVDSSRIIPQWILYLLIRKWQLGVLKAICHRHVHQAGINVEDLLNLEISIPSLVEQQNIVGVLGVVDLAIAKADEVLAKTERLKKGLMQELLTKGIGHEKYKQTPIGKTPTTWEVVQVKDIVEDVKRGPFGGSIKKEIFVPEGYKVYEQKNVIHNDFEIGGYFIDEEKFRKLQSFAIKEGDILLTGAGTIGRISVVPKNYKLGIINQALIKIRLNKNKILVPYFAILLTYETFRKKVLERSHGATMKNVSSVKELKSIKIPLPPLGEQQEIADILAAVDKKLNLERKEKTTLEKVKLGLMDLLLTGKIRVNVD